jgi:hypothetical protein
MEPTDVDRLVAAARAGRRVRVPFSTTLWPDTQSYENVLVVRADGRFELTTTFAEFWAGHGWSVPRTEVEEQTEEQVRSALTMYAAEQCEVLPEHPDERGGPARSPHG